MKKAITVTAVFFMAINSFIFAQEKTAELTNEFNRSKVKILTLSNNLTLFVKEDPSMALARVDFLCKAGYESQTKSTTGYFSLYSRLFGSNTNLKVESSCSADHAKYSATVPVEFLQDHFENLCQALVSPVFSDKMITFHFNNAKKEIFDYDKSPVSLINTAIDSKIFYKEPWKVESGIYPSLFASSQNGEVRNVLKDIGKKYYTPDNCALFICGNIKAERIFNLCESVFENWQGKYTPLKETVEKDKKMEQKKFVIADKDFSSDLTQIIVQFTSGENYENDVFAAVTDRNESDLKQTLCTKKELGIRSPEYIGISSARKKNVSRLIFQSLFEKDLADSDPVIQAQIFVDSIKENALIGRRNFISGQEQVYSAYRIINSSPAEYMNLVENFWAWTDSSTQEFYGDFIKFCHQSQNANQDVIAKKLKKENPFVFLVINSKVLDEFKVEFEQQGYEIITKENSSWYKEQVLKNLAHQEADKRIEQSDDINSIVIDKEITPDEIFYYKNHGSLKNGILGNGIPLTVKENSNSGAISLCLGIKGGSSASPQGELELQNVLINSLAKNIQDQFNDLHFSSKGVSVYATTKENISWITMNCTSEDFSSACRMMSDTIIFSNISPSTADRRADDIYYRHNMRSAYLTEQLRCNALKYLYRGTVFEKCFDLDSPVLKNTTYHSINLEYTKLLDASLYNIVICGDTDFTTAFNVMEETFGLLMEQSPRDKQDIPQPKFKNKTRKVQLRHTFTSDKPKEMAPSGVPILVPTKNFYDPALLIFKSPCLTENIDAAELASYNCVLYGLEILMQEKLTENLYVTLPNKRIPLGTITGEKIQYTNAFLNTYKDSRKKLMELLDNGEFLDFIKYRWYTRELEKTSSNSGTAELIQDGIQYGKPWLYMEQYTAVSNFIPQDLLPVIEKYFPEEPEMAVYSVDSKHM